MNNNVDDQATMLSPQKSELIEDLNNSNYLPGNFTQREKGSSKKQSTEGYLFLNPLSCKNPDESSSEEQSFLKCKNTIESPS